VSAASSALFLGSQRDLSPTLVQVLKELRRFYVKQVESISEFADWSDEELEAFIKSPMPLPHGKAKH
jgi:hypothetical protein